MRHIALVTYVLLEKDTRLTRRKTFASNAMVSITKLGSHVDLAQLIPTQTHSIVHLVLIRSSLLPMQETCIQNINAAMFFLTIA